MKKKVLAGVSFSLLLIFIFLVTPSTAVAQACIGNSGGTGRCLDSLTCGPSRLDGFGNCPTVPGGPGEPDRLYCCLDEILPPAPVTPPSGSANCGDTCGADSDCNSGLSCSPSAGICTGSGCPLCTGANSSFFGTCQSPSVCAASGGTNEGQSNCPLGFGWDCCTDAPSSETCSLTATPPFFTSFEFPVSLSSTTPNTIYHITSSSGCFGTCLGDKATNSSGSISCRLACAPPATYTITASSGSINCALDIDVGFASAPPCTGVGSNLSGICVASVLCPSAYFPDGDYPDVCNLAGQRCCVPGTGYENVKEEIFCAGSDPGDRTSFNTGKLATAIGCIPIGSGQGFISFVLKWAFGIGGGIAFLLILYAGFMIMTSSGDPKKLQAGRELLTSAIAGLLLLIFSVFLLRFIGVDILGIPGLEG